eukprot:TRINITY_DN12604_c0_g1_i6.p1 TRINITY_DN12604_c0_g1~~TRINITY_DN12604_c0_g1_i6.p1  ORF type:complete len:449 (+),score=106.25 TRINITY_DN12604_c0_g1_i6:378-1724(+)
MLFANFKEHSIQGRKQKLEHYLNQAAALVPHLLELPLARDFFEVNSRQSAAPVRAHRRSQSIFIAEFLKKLNGAALKVREVVEEFEEIFFASAPELSQSDVSLLFLGEGSLKGLLYFCGSSIDPIDNVLCLKLFSKLLSPKDNTASTDKCTSTFLAIAPEAIKSMNLQLAMQSQQSIACSILYKYVMGNAQGVMSGKEIVKDAKALEEYEKWLTMNSLKEPPKVELDNTFKQLMKKSMEKVKLTRDLVESSNLSALNDMKELMEQFDSYSGWKLAETNEIIDAYTKGQKMFRVTLRISSSDIKAVTRYFYELEKREMWDPLHYMTLKKTGEYQSIVQLLYDLPTNKHKHIEYIQLRNLGRSEDRNSVLIVVRSLLLPESSVQSIRRTHVNASVCRLTAREKCVECQMLWKVEEGIEGLAEYSMWRAKKMDANVKLLNQFLLQEAIVPM